MVTLETSTLGIKEIIEELENCISNFLNIQELRRKPNSKLMPAFGTYLMIQLVAR